MDININNDIDNQQQYEQVASIKVIGVGGAGNNAVNRMIEAGVQGVDFYAANTDAQVLNASKTKNRIILGRKITKGFGAGANPEIGQEAAIESEAEIKEALSGADMIFIAAGMGGGTGTGAAHVIARIAKDLGALTIAIVTKPFTFEGKQRNNFSVTGIEKLRKNVDAIIIISNDKLLKVIGNIPLKDSFKEADNILRQGVQTITDLIAVPALINLDFADVKTILKNKGSAMFGIGIAKGESKAKDSALKAISSPLLDDVTIKGAKNLILNITGGSTMTLIDANNAVEIVREAAGNEVNIIFGVAINEQLNDAMIVTCIATGFDYNYENNDSISNHNKVDILDFINQTNIINNNDQDKTARIYQENNVDQDKTVIDYDQKTTIISDEKDEEDDIPAFLRQKNGVN